MKKIVTILSITVIVFICLGYFFEYDSMLRGNLARNFDANIYISSKPSVAKKNIIRNILHSILFFFFCLIIII